MSGQEYVAVVTSEPITGLPSNRIYGPFKSYDDGRLALMHASVITAEGDLAPGWASCSVQLLRPTETLDKERP